MKSESKFHVPALLNESIDLLRVQEGELYFDLTVGGGGSSLEIIRRGGRVFALDQDPEAVDYARKRLTSACPSGVFTPHQLNRGAGFTVVEANFIELENQVQEHRLPKPAGILLDLGTSHFQIKKSGRGFSFERNEPLDMRMNPQMGVTAADLLKVLSLKQLARLFREFGEERHAREIARTIVKRRKEKPIKATQELADLVVALYKGKRGKIHPATKVFQALRIAVNSELENLRMVLPQALQILKSNGRLVVISFHSLEDRMVKNFLRTAEQKGKGEVLTKKPVKSDKEELLKNPRARSAKLRAFQKR